MELAILILLALLLMTVSFGYLIAGDLAGGRWTEKLGTAVGKHRKTLIFLVLAWGLLSAVAIVLVRVYPSNTLIANMKLIVLLAVLVTVAVTDMREMIIPNRVILAGLVLRAALATAELLTLRKAYLKLLRGELLAVGLVAIVFLLGVLIVKNGIGMGDIKLMLVMGLFQGLYGLISALFFSLTVSFFIAIAMLIAKKKTRKDAIPFAPSVLIGTTISVFLTGM
ncbi:MAG: prepilin peptidase [Clostridia bacterium]|nr:prepilin peptidase [Clostridia bacterium]